MKQGASWDTIRSSSGFKVKWLYTGVKLAPAGPVVFPTETTS